MTTSFTIPFDKILEKSFELRDENPDMTIEEIIKQVLPSINIQIQSDISLGVKKKTIKNEVSEEKNTKKKEFTDEDRCLARTCYEAIHMDHSTGKLITMRDDPKNLYGDRCKCKKKPESKFCTRHSGYQPLGIWNGIYDNKFHKYVQFTEGTSVIPEKTKKNTKSSNEECLIVDNPSKSSNKQSNKNKKQESSDEDSIDIDVDSIIIKGKEYFIDTESNLYSEDGEHIGTFDHENDIIIPL